MRFTVQHLLEAREHASASHAAVLEALEEAELTPLPDVDVDLDITEIIPPKRLEILCARTKRR